jgi:hypothetical protein
MKTKIGASPVSVYLGSGLAQLMFKFYPGSATRGKSETRLEITQNAG